MNKSTQMLSMKNTVFLLFLLFLTACSSSSNNAENETQEEKIILTISGEARNNQDCSRKCIRISDVKVQLDDCYDQDTEVFTKDCEAQLNDKKVYATLLNTDAQFWAEIENEIDQNHDENAGLPFIVTITKNKETSSYILLRIENQPTKKNHDLMRQLTHLFDNWENCVAKE